MASVEQAQHVLQQLGNVRAVGPHECQRGLNRTACVGQRASPHVVRRVGTTTSQTLPCALSLIPQLSCELYVAHVYRRVRQGVGQRPADRELALVPP